MIRVIFLLLLSSIAFASNSQSWNSYLQKRFKSFGLWADSISIQPSDTTNNKAAKSIAVIGSSMYVSNGTFWTAITGGGSSLPSQTGNARKFLKTDGTTASWGLPNFADSVDFAGSGVGMYLRINPGGSGTKKYDFANVGGINTITGFSPIIVTGSGSLRDIALDTTNSDYGLLTRGRFTNINAANLTISSSNSTFQRLDNLQSDLTASATKYPSVNAVNTGLSNLNASNITAGTLPISRLDTGRGTSQSVTGGSLNKVKDSLQANIDNKITKGSSATQIVLSNGTFQKTAPYALTYSLTLDLNYANSTTQTVTLTGNTTFSFSNFPDGGVMFVYITQDGTGGRTSTFPTIKVGGNGSGVVTLSTLANATDAVAIQKVGSNYFVNYQLNFN
jgi:hypothetical protein